MKTDINQLMTAFAGNKKAKIIAISVVAVIGLAIIIYCILRFTKLKNIVADELHNKQLAGSLEQEITPTSITLTQAQFNSYASALKSAMAGWGTNEEKIYDVFRNMGSRSDVLQLIKTFGIQKGQTLNEWLHNDLSESEIDKVNQILAGNGISYNF